MLGREGQGGEEQHCGQAPGSPRAGVWGCVGCTPSLTIFSAAVLLMKRDPCPGLPTHFTFIPAAAGGEGGIEQKVRGSTGAPAPSRARDRVVGTQLLTPRALLAIEDTVGVGRAGQACGGQTGGQRGMRGP